MAPAMDSSLTELQKIPGIGKSLSKDLYSLGILSVKDLLGKDPEQLYQKLCEQTGTKQDRCVLYVFRCAVYFATHPDPKPELLLWWNWKDKNSKTKRKV